MTLAQDRYVSSRFDALEGRFRAEVPEDDYRLQAVRRAVDAWAGRTVLDLGCGKGRFARHFERWGARVVGVDGSREMLARGDGRTRVRARAGSLPFPSECFDVAVAIEVLQHVARWDQALRELHRVLRPGGRVVIVDRNALALDANRPWLPSLAVKWVDERRGRWMYPPDAPFRERWFRPTQLAAQLAGEARFEGVRCAGLLAPRERGSWVFRLFPGVRGTAIWTGRKGRHGHD